MLIDGTIYVTTVVNTYAIDARTGAQRWMHHWDAKSMGLGTPVCGVAYADGRLFRGTPDGHLVALDAKAGAVTWDVVGADTTKGEYYTAAPVVWNGRVYMADSGSDVGAIGHIRAFDAQKGKQSWNYVPTIDWATTIKLGGPEHLKLEPGMPFLGSANGFGTQDPIDQRRGHVTAVDADSGKVLWKYDADTSMVASVTPTAAGIVLTGDTKGNLLVFDGKDGRVLFKKNLGDPIGGGIIPYEIDGKAYVAVAGGMKNTVTQQTDSGPAWVSILSLPQ